MLMMDNPEMHQQLNTINDDYDDNSNIDSNNYSKWATIVTIMIIKR